MSPELVQALERILFDPMIGKAVSILVGVSVILFVARLLRNSVRQHVEDSQGRYRLAKVVSFISYGLVALLISVVFSDKLGGFTTAFGVAGAGVAFALQEVIVSIAGWLAISGGGYYHTGDRVQLAGIKGDVIDISMLRTTIMELGQWVDGDQYNGRIVRIANSNVFTGPVFNYSADFPFLWDEIKIPIRYGSDLDQAEKILLAVAEEVVGAYGREAATSWRQVAKTYMVEDANTLPMVMMVATDNWAAYTLRYVVAYSKRRSTQHALYRRIVDEIGKTDNAVQLASGTYEIVGVPPIRVQIDPTHGPA